MPQGLRRPLATQDLPSPTPKDPQDPDHRRRLIHFASQLASAEAWNLDHPPHTLVRVTKGPNRGRLARTCGRAYVEAQQIAVVKLRRWGLPYPLQHLRVIEGPTRL